MQLDPFQVPDVPFTYAAASGPLHSPVTATWKPTENPTGSQLVGCTILTSQGGISKEYKAGPKGRGLRAKGMQMGQKLTPSGAGA